MADLTTGKIFTNGETNIDHNKLNQIIGLSSITGSFVGSKTVITSILGNDSLLIYRNDATYAKVGLTDFANALTVASPNFEMTAVGPLQAYNSVINGDMQIWQRLTSKTAVTSGTYIADRWKMTISSVGSGVNTSSQQAINLTGASNYPNTKYALRTTVTTSQASMGASDVYY